jgi:O-methyltransferase
MPLGLVRRTNLRELAKRLSFRYLAAVSAPRYGYGLDPAALAFLVTAISERAATPGCVVEIGVARGMTTRFLVEHMVREGIRKRYHALDTFSSFVPEDMAYERSARGKTAADLAGFTYNDVGVWRRNFRAFDFVHAHPCDCKTFSFTAIAPIAVAILDVDLYLPTKHTLPRLYDSLEPGGVILVDDVRPDARWDGAAQALAEFCRERGLSTTPVGTKGAVLHRAARLSG